MSERLRQIWESPLAVGLRRLVRLIALAATHVVALIVRALLRIWRAFSPRARIVLTILGLALISRTTRATAPSLSAVAQALATLLLSFVGFWWILTAPFRTRRWWR